MSTVAEIEAAIERLPHEQAIELQQWLDQRLKNHLLSREELMAVAQRMVDETDPVRAEELKEEFMRGFYGEERA